MKKLWEFLGGLFSPPRIVAVEAPHAPIALLGGRTLLHVTLEGSGVLVVDGQRRFFGDGLTQTLLVRVAPLIRFSVWGFFGRDVRTFSLTPLTPGPAPPAVPTNALVEHKLQLPAVTVGSSRLRAPPLPRVRDFRGAAVHTAFCQTAPCDPARQRSDSSSSPATRPA